MRLIYSRRENYKFYSNIVLLLMCAFLSTGKVFSRNADVANKDDMVLIKGGMFMMGDIFYKGYGNEFPIHNVELNDFLVGKYEITQYEWNMYMPEKNYRYGKGIDYPVYHINWYEAVLYCNKRSIGEGLEPCYSINNSKNSDDWGAIPYGLNDKYWDCIEWDQNANGYRLLTEAEWEYASKYNNENDCYYSYSGSNIINEVGWYSFNSNNKIHPVGLKRSNHYGIYDMTGNLAEWCWDKYNSGYFIECSEKVVKNPIGPREGSYRIYKGGACTNTEKICRNSSRSYSFPGLIYKPVGLRIARSIR